MVISLQNIYKQIGSQAIIQDVSFSISKGQVFALLGPNGAGKTTLIRLMLGVLQPDSGTIRLCNQELTATSRTSLLSLVGVQNDGNLYEELTVYENLSIWGELYGLGPSEISNRLEQLSQMFQIGDYMNLPAAYLSKGNKQKVLLARAVLHQPRVLILDEPTTGLDPEAIDEFYSFIKQLKESGITIVMCTHYLYGMDGIVDAIGIIKKGRLVVAGPVDALMSKDRVIQFRGLFQPADVNQLKMVGKVEGNKQTSFQLTLEDVGLVPDIIRTLSQSGNQIDEVYQKKESLKDIYFRLIEGELHEV